MAISDLDIQLDLLNLPRVSKVLQDLQHLQEIDINIRKGLKQGARYLIKQGKARLKARMKSGYKGVSGNLLRSFKSTIKRKNRGILAGFKRWCWWW